MARRSQRHGRALTWLRPAPWLAGAFVLWWSWDRGKPYRSDGQLRLDVKVEAAPLVGRLEWEPRLAHLAPLFIGALIIWGWPRVPARLSFGWASTLAAVATGSFAVSLAATGGLDRIMDPVVAPTEYWVNLPTLPGIEQTLRSWSDVEFLLRYTTHLKGHPPGYVVSLQMLHAIGLGKPWVVAAVSWLSLAAITPGMMLIVRQFVSDGVSRSLAPFLAVAPFAVWTATSADAFFACLLVWGTASMALAASSERRRRVVGFGLMSGAVLGFALFTSYGIALGLMIPIAVLMFVPMISGADPNGPGQNLTGQNLTGRIVAAGAAAVGAGVVTIAFRLSGFWWFDGLSTTKKFYEWGTAQFRPQSYFVVANLAVLLIALGPAFVGGVGRLGASRLWAVVGSAMLAVVIADLSAMSKAEVERIWLIFMPFLMVATVRLPRPRVWLCAQLTVALLLQVWLRTKW